VRAHLENYKGVSTGNKISFDWRKRKTGSPAFLRARLGKAPKRGEENWERQQGKKGRSGEEKSKADFSNLLVLKRNHRGGRCRKRYVEEKG